MRKRCRCEREWYEVKGVEFHLFHFLYLLLCRAVIPTADGTAGKEQQRVGNGFVSHPSQLALPHPLITSYRALILYASLPHLEPSPSLDPQSLDPQSPLPVIFLRILPPPL